MYGINNVKHAEVSLNGFSVSVVYSVEGLRPPEY